MADNPDPLAGPHGNIPLDILWEIHEGRPCDTCMLWLPPYAQEALGYGGMETRPTSTTALTAYARNHAAEVEE